ncbi:uncharacterized protein LOC134775103 [Penaeus indicus]|uniref:uncharacterized protein LOC134775103 n=1 Tax=Penaeus indicus TaxID=29960 RepID=UPI00300D7D01
MVNLVMERKVDVLCVQETRWAGNKAKELDAGFKSIYGGADNDKRNGIGIILSRDLKDLVTDVNKRNDWIMWVRLALENFQDLNGHIGSGYDAISRIHGGNVYGDGNEDGEKIIDFALFLDTVIGNTLFTINLAIAVTRRQKRKVTTEKRIKWFKLKDHDVKQQFNDRLLRDIDLEIEDVNEWWNRVSVNIIGAGKEVLGETSGKIWENREAWWFYEEVQEKVKAKKVAKKRWEETKPDRDRENYKECCKEVKRAVAIAKAEAHDNLYDNGQGHMAYQLKFGRH